MSLNDQVRETNRAAKAKKKKAKRRKRQVEVIGWNIEEWCRRRRMSRQHYYDLKAKGLGPAELRHGRSVQITEKADREWETRHTVAAA